MPITCPRCGSEHMDGKRTCGKCWADLTQVGRNIVTPNVMPPPPPVSVTPPPEAQEMERVTYVGFVARFIAFIIDVGLLFGVIMAIMYPMVKAVDDADETGKALVGLAYLFLRFVFPWLYFAIMESSSLQGSLGKIIVRVKVVDREGRRISFGRSAGRSAAKYLSALTCYIGFLMAAFTEDHRGLHDMIAGTYVVQK